MNERILDICIKAGINTWPFNEVGFISLDESELEKFAELIVRECAVYCEGHILPRGMAEQNDLDYNDGIMDCAIGLKTIFGIE